MSDTPIATESDTPDAGPDLARVVRDFGFDPSKVSATVQRVGVTASGPRAGELCVFTEDLTPDPRATAQANFTETDRTHGPYADDPGYLVYIFVPLRPSSTTLAARRRHGLARAA